MQERPDYSKFIERLKMSEDETRVESTKKRHSKKYRTARENLNHLVDGVKLGNASAVLAASIFHYGKHSVKEAKEYLDSKGIPVRI